MHCAVQIVPPNDSMLAGLHCFKKLSQNSHGLQFVCDFMVQIKVTALYQTFSLHGYLVAFVIYINTVYSDVC